MIDFGALIGEHAEIDRLIAEVEDLSRSSTPCPAEVLGALTTLHATLAEHLCREDDMMYPRLVDDAEIAVSAPALAMISEFHYLTGDWSLYLLSWPLTRISAEWARFGQETRALMARLHRRVDRENSLLYRSSRAR